VFLILKKEIANVDVLFLILDLFLKIFLNKMFSKFEGTYFHFYFLFSLKKKIENNMSPKLNNQNTNFSINILREFLGLGKK